jgi:hypothetical protein
VTLPEASGLLRWKLLRLTYVAFLFGSFADALEIQGFLTKDCQRRVGLIVHVDEKSVYFIKETGELDTLPVDQFQTLYVFNVIENPISQVHVDAKLLPFLKALYLENSNEPQTYAFPVRFIEDLQIFYSLDGKTRVLTYADIYKLRPAPENLEGTHATASSKRMSFAFTDPSAHCAGAMEKGAVKPTRILSDPISINEFLESFQRGYERIASFEERTYLYAKPFLYQKKARLGLVFEGKHDEPAIMAPLYFQFSTGEPYRLQSFNAISL